MKRFSIIIFALLLVSLPSVSQAVSWADPFGGANLQLAIGKVIKYALGFVGVVGLLGFLYGGGMWMLAGGDPKAVGKSKNILVSTAIGMAIIIFSSIILNFLTTSISGVTQGGGAAGPTSAPAASSGAGTPRVCSSDLASRCLYGVNDQTCECKLSDECVRQSVDVAFGGVCRENETWTPNPDGSCKCVLEKTSYCLTAADCDFLEPACAAWLTHSCRNKVCSCN